VLARINDAVNDRAVTIHGYRHARFEFYKLFKDVETTKMDMLQQEKSLGEGSGGNQKIDPELVARYESAIEIEHRIRGRELDRF